MTTASVTSGTAELYRRTELRRWGVILIAAIVVAIFAGWVSILGVADTNLGELFSVLWSRATFGLFATDVDPMKTQVIIHLRLPRVVMALLVGAALSVSGVLMQAISRNPLVSPYTIGVSSAAAFGASLAIMFGLADLGPYFVPISAVVFAIGCATLVFSMAWFRGMGAQTLVLTGIALMYLFSALTAAIQFFATQEQLARVVHWTFGSLNDSSWDKVVVIAIVFVVTLPLVMRGAWALNAVTSGGDEVASSLGINVPHLRISAMFFAVLLAAVVISFTGVIGFVGLIGPHVARMLIGADHRALLPFSMLCGGALLLAADTVGRLLFSPIIIPVGIVVAFVGVPLFLHLVLSRRKEYFS